MTRAEIEKNLRSVLHGDKSVSNLILKDGTCFQTDTLLFEDQVDEINGTLEAVDDEYPEGKHFAIDDIVELEIC